MRPAIIGSVPKEIWDACRKRVFMFSYSKQRQETPSHETQSTVDQPAPRSRQIYPLSPPASMQAPRIPPEGSGRKLPSDIGREFRRRSGHDVSDVRVHLDHEPLKVGALAYARGSHLHFVPDRYEPQNERGRELIRHELRHVVQQREGLARRGSQLINDSPQLERDADRISATPASQGRARSARPVPVAQAPIQRVVLNHRGEAYSDQDLKASPWYARLSLAERSMVDRMHGSPERFDQQAVHHRLSLPHKPSWQNLHAVNQYPETGQKLQAYRREREYGGANVSEDVLSPQEAKRAAYRSKLLKLLNDSQDAIAKRGAESSDSDTEVGDHVEAQEKRRQVKAEYLAGLAGTFFPLTDDELKFAGRLRDHRLRDNQAFQAQGDAHRSVYASDTRRELAQVGQRMRHTSMEHNPYLRRSFHAAISPQQIRAGGSQAYNSSQGSIRAKLKDVLAADHKKMNWQRSDFPDDRTWAAVQFMMREGISNSSSVDSYASRVRSGQATAGSSTRTAFHHLAWKEADPDFARHALNPANLIAMNDQRELLNPTKHAAAAAAGTLPVPGDHDIFGHQAQGYRSDQQNVFAHAKGGGQFKDIDLEATAEIADQVMRPRLRKRDLYGVPRASWK